MWRRRALLFVAGATAALLFSRTATIAVLTKNELVYTFSYSSLQDVYARDSKNPAEPIDLADRLGSGTSHYHGSLTERGTITVHIGLQQDDGGLIVTISEQGENVRRAPPANCVVYGNTYAICDPNKTVYPEEYTLLRFLGRNFVDPASVDDNGRWTISRSSPSADMQAEYHINSSSNGILQIAENRRIRVANAGSQTIDVQTKIGYDSNQKIPKSVDEYVTERVDNGVVGTTTTTYQTTLTLVESNLGAEAAQ